MKAEIQMALKEGYEYREKSGEPPAFLGPFVAFLPYSLPGNKIRCKWYSTNKECVF